MLATKKPTRMLGCFRPDCSADHALGSVPSLQWPLVATHVLRMRRYVHYWILACGLVQFVRREGRQLGQTGDRKQNDATVLSLRMVCGLYSAAQNSDAEEPIA